MMMKCVFVCLSLWICLNSARPKWNELSSSYNFEQYKADFSKVYHTREENEMRRGFFAENLNIILHHNANPSASYRMGVNHMTDWTREERKSLLGYHKGLAHRQVTERSQKYAEGKLAKIDFGNTKAPISVDWRNKGILSAVKDQGQCGSCWSFSSAETLESHWALATDQLNVLSEQHILSCTPNPYDCGGNGGCGGGTTELAYSYLMLTGLASEWKYPYLSWYGNNSKCRFDPTKVGSVAYLSDYVALPTNDYQSVLNAVAFVGPLAIAVDASQWHNYETGIFDQCDTASPDIDHGVQLVGYGTDTKTGTPYWIIRNSWTPTFGENGYIRVKRDNPPVCGVDMTPLDGTGCVGGPSNVTVCGMCGVLFDVVYPVVKTN